MLATLVLEHLITCFIVNAVRQSKPYGILAWFTCGVLFDKPFITAK